MVVGVLRLELLLHAPQSLKEKRGIVKKLTGRLRERFPVSCAETGYHDLWQRSQLGCAAVGQNEASLHQLFERIEAEILRSALADISDSQIEFLHYS